MTHEYKEYHRKQYEETYRSTVSLIHFIEKFIPYQNHYEVLDVGCGGGANIFHLKNRFRNWKFTGLDIDRDLIQYAKKRNPDCEFFVMDFFDINKNIKRSFDITLAIQFVSFVGFDLNDFLENIAIFTSRYAVITGLFSPGWLEQHTIAYDLQNNWKGIYKVYSIERLKNLAIKSGFKEIIFEPFDIDIYIPKPNVLKFGTYTERTHDNRLLQISGYMLMPWYNVILRK